MAITAKDVKQLRDMTGAGMMDSKRALQEAERLLQDGTLSDQMQAGREALGLNVTPSRGPAFSLPPELKEVRPFVDQAIGQAPKPDAASRPADDHRIRPLVLVSFSLPESQIHGLLKEAGRLKASVVIRGLIHDDWPETIAKLSGLAQEGLGGVSIDPTIFRRFQVSRVPTFILPLERLKPCTPAACTPTEHVRTTGSASLAYFLDFVARTGTDKERHKARNWLAAHQGGTP